jgi:hypothetical protein
MEKSYDALIAAKESEISALRQEMEPIRLRIITEAARSVEAWYPKRAKEIVTAEPKIAEALGTDGLREMKREVEDLVSRAKELAAEALNAPSLWWHTQNPPPIKSPENSGIYRVGDLYLSKQGMNPPALSKPFDTLISALGAIIYSRGFMKTGPSGHYYVANTGHPWSSELQTALTDYSHKVSSGVKMLEAIESLREQKRKVSVVDLWDSL